MSEDKRSSVPDDQKLVRRVLRGDREAFETIVRKYQQPMLNYVSRMVHEREMALDVSQEVFLRAYASLSSFRPEYKFSTWLFRIASNYLIDHWRKKKVSTVSLDQPVDDDDDGCYLQVADEKASVVLDLEMKELRTRLEAAIEQSAGPFAGTVRLAARHRNELRGDGRHQKTSGRDGEKSGFPGEGINAKIARGAVMPCLTADRYYAYLDGDLSPAEKSAVDRHLAACEACRLALTARTRIMEAAAGLPAFDLPADFATGSWPAFPFRRPGPGRFSGAGESLSEPARPR